MTTFTVRSGLAAFFLAAGVVLAAGCDGGSAGGTGGNGATAGEARCTMPRQVACVDQSIQTLGLKNTANPAVVSNMGLGGGVFESSLDASGGGLNPTQSYVYARFTADGLEKVAISDEDAFSSMDWDIALRRYIIRVNGGSSGPSCVEAAETDSNTTLASLTTVPGALGWETDLFLEPPACSAGTDQSPLGGPLTAIAGYYRYEACLIMTGSVFVLRLKNGAHVALEVAGYYNKEAQAYCNTMGKLPGGATGAGTFTLRWKFLPAKSG